VANGAELDEIGRLFDGSASGLRAEVEKVYDFEQCIDLFKHNMAGRTRGKVVLRVGSAAEAGVGSRLEPNGGADRKSAAPPAASAATSIPASPDVTDAKARSASLLASPNGPVVGSVKSVPGSVLQHLEEINKNEPTGPAAAAAAPAAPAGGGGAGRTIN
jgi:hypothetical protein